MKTIITICSFLLMLVIADVSYADSIVQIKESITNNTGKMVNDLEYQLHQKEPWITFVDAQSGSDSFPNNNSTISPDGHTINVVNSGANIAPGQVVDVWTMAVLSQKNRVWKDNVWWTLDGVPVPALPGQGGPNGEAVPSWDFLFSPLYPDPINHGKYIAYLWLSNDNGKEDLIFKNVQFLISQDLLLGESIADPSLTWEPSIGDITISPNSRSSQIKIDGITLGEFINFTADIWTSNPGYQETVWGTHEANEVVPEPTTMLLFSTGVASLAGLSFRRKE